MVWPLNLRNQRLRAQCSGTGKLAPPSLSSRETDESALKSDILASIRTEVSVIIRMEMNAALVEDFNCIKGKHQAMRAEAVNKVLRAGTDQVRISVKEANKLSTGLMKWRLYTVPWQN